MHDTSDDLLSFYGRTFKSRFLLGTANYPSPEILKKSLLAANAGLMTVGLKRQLANGKANSEAFFAMIRECATEHSIQFLPNTAGCKTAYEAIQLALMARELFDSNLIKLEVIGDDYTLQADPFELLEATRELIAQDFNVMPYCTDDLVLCQRLFDAGCQVLMPWGSPIGSGQGLINPGALKMLRDRIPDAILIVDAGLRSPSDAAKAMEIGFDAVLLNTAVAQAIYPEKMAKAFNFAIGAGREAYLAGLMTPQAMAVPSTPVLGRPFVM